MITINHEWSLIDFPTEILVELLLVTCLQCKKVSVTCQTMTNVARSNRRLHTIVTSPSFVASFLIRMIHPRPPLVALCHYSRFALRNETLDHLYVISRSLLGSYEIDRTLGVLSARSRTGSPLLWHAFTKAFSRVLAHVLEDFPTYTLPTDYYRTFIAFETAVQELSLIHI